MDTDPDRQTLDAAGPDPQKDVNPTGSGPITLLLDTQLFKIVLFYIVQYN
jgi:hypothetical protein